MKQCVAAGVLPLLSLFWGFAIEMLSVEGFWPAVLAVFLPLVLLFTAGLAAGLGENPKLLTGAGLGLVAGCLVGITFVLGVSSPFALGLGERKLNDLGGGDLAWQATLTLAFIIWASGGAVVGLVCGAAAWALRVSLGDKRAGHETETREVAR